MREMLARLLGKTCEHEHTLVVRSVGVQRSVCEECGFVSFSMVAVNDHRPFEAEPKSELPRASGL